MASSSIILAHEVVMQFQVLYPKYDTFYFCIIFNRGTPSKYPENTCTTTYKAKFPNCYKIRKLFYLKAVLVHSFDSLNFLSIKWNKDWIWFVKFYSLSNYKLYRPLSISVKILHKFWRLNGTKH